ncbi:MAG: S9 family peptidase [Planctomycetes bacterium]|nr:S9 family peptidase [Planctomycetota bacterium]
MFKVLCLLVLVGQVFAQQPLSPEKLWQFVRQEGGAFAADGKHVMVIERRTELATEATTAVLKVLNVDSGSARVLQDGIKGLGDAQWGVHADEPCIYCLHATAAGAQVFRINLAGKETQLTNVEGGVSAVRIAANGKMLVYAARVKLDAQLLDLHPDLPKADARIIDSLMYRHWDEWRDGTYSHIFAMPLDDEGRPQAATDLMRGLRVDCPLPPFGGREHFAVAPDGSMVAFCAKMVNRPERSTDSDVYVVPSSGGALVNLTQEFEGYDTDPVFSPDGKTLAWLSMPRAGFEADKSRLMLCALAGNGRRELTVDFDGSAHDPEFSPDGQSLWFNSEVQGTVQLFSVAVDKSADQEKDNAVQLRTSGNFNWALGGSAPDGTRRVLARQDMLRPVELFLQTGSAEPQVLTHANDALVQSLALPTVQSHRVRATDGREIQCWVLLPPGFDAAKKHPLLLYCQGGPQSQIGQSFSMRWNFHLMAAQGYVVLAVNRRGLPGFGQEWNDEISGDWGGQAMQDLLAACDHFTAQPWVDARRVGAVGASFGGYSVYWLMGNGGDRFRAMIAHCGVFNLESMYGGTEELFFVDWDLGGPYWGSEGVRAKYEKFSPHRFVGAWRTPLLVVHGEKDFRVPVGQGMEAFTAAQSMGVPSRFLYFPGEGHWVMRPQNSVLWQRVFFDWLQRHLAP